MRRATIQTLHVARRTPVRKLLGYNSFLTSSNHGLNTKSGPSGLRRFSTSSQHLQSSMQYKSLSVALASSLVAGGAWLFNVRQQTPIDSKSPIASQSRSFSTSSNAFTAAHSAAESSIPSSGPSVKRRALVVDNDQFYTGSIEGDEPLSKDTDGYGRKVLEMMTPDDATARLRKTEESYIVNRGRGVVRYDVATLPSNDPIEDDHAEKVVEVPNTVAATDGDVTSSDWMFWGIFDGHSGWTTSAKLRQALISFVARELNTTYKAALSSSNPASADTSSSSFLPSPSAIDSAIKLGFLKLDHEICHAPIPTLSKVSKSEASAALAPALSGSCGLLSFYDTRSKTLRVACTGDSRAVLGRRNSSTGKWYATPLSEDQTGSNPTEESRMRAEHPNEPSVIRSGRVLGQLEPTRAFGDATYKWTRDIQDKIKRHFFGRNPSPLLRTPPYVTAEPVVTSTQIEPANGDFVVLATDGLWEMLTNEEVVGLVGQWIEGQNRKSFASSTNSAWLTSWFRSASSPPASLPVEKGGNSDKTGQIAAANSETEAPIRQQQWNLNPSESASKRWTVQDANAATHLVRNALGGRDTDMVCALLTLPTPYSRRYRDDLTVEVVFFGEGQGVSQGEGGGVRVNEEASMGLQEEGLDEGMVKAKL